MPRDSALPLSMRSRHLADGAHAELRLGHTKAAEAVLLTMERAARSKPLTSSCRVCWSVS
jgi:hypothetical protein